MTQQPARTVYCGKGLSAAELDGYHVMHQHVAEFFLTESVFPAGFHVPKHIHNYHCIYLVLDGRFSETYQHRENIRERFDVVLTPIGEPHAATREPDIPKGVVGQITEPFKSRILNNERKISFINLRVYYGRSRLSVAGNGIYLRQHDSAANHA